MSDRIAILRDGHVEQVGAPQEVYARPATRFVAEFLGEANLLPAAEAVAIGLADSGDAPRPGTAVVRPEHCSIGAPEALGAHGVVHDVSYQGTRHRVVVRVQSGEVRQIVVSIPAEADAPVREGDNVTVRVAPERVHVIADDGAEGAPEPAAVPA
jgi:putative spermidine/putrescine transport system ATP-binding protein